MTARNVTVENEVVEHSWTADCIRAGSVDEIVLAVRAFAGGRLGLLRYVLCRNWMVY